MSYAFDPDYGPYRGAAGDPRNDYDVCPCDGCEGAGKVDGDPCDVCDGLGGFDVDGDPAKYYP